MATIISSITAISGNTLIQVMNDGWSVTNIAAAFSPNDPTTFTVSYSGSALPIIAYDTAANPSSPTMGDILLSGSWSPSPGTGVTIEIAPAGGGGGGDGGGGGGGPGIYTIDAFSYDAGTNRTQFTLFKDGVPSADNFPEPGQFTVNSVALTLVTQSNDPQPYFIVSGQWTGLASGDVVTYTYTGARRKDKLISLGGRVPEADLTPDTRDVPREDLTPDVRDVPRTELIPLTGNKGNLIPS